MFNVTPVKNNSINVVPNKLSHTFMNRNNPKVNDKLRQTFPNCPLNCEESWIGDGWCDKECFTDLCGNDGGDCTGWCAPECRPSWLGDGQCDIDCFNPKCNWDNDDCKGQDIELKKKIALILEKNDVNSTNIEFDYSYCNCNKELLGNNICDIECNKIECNMDKGDCLHRCNSLCINTWLGDGQCDPNCDTEECFFDKGDCETCSGNCRTWMIGNGICDNSCNNKQCNFDGGDCANICSVSKVDYNHQPLIYKFCLNSWVGDGYCDEDCNNENCEFDKNDCKTNQLDETISDSLYSYEAGLNTPKKIKDIKNQQINTNLVASVPNLYVQNRYISGPTTTTTTTFSVNANMTNQYSNNTKSLQMIEYPTYSNAPSEYLTKNRTLYYQYNYNSYGSRDGNYTDFGNPRSYSSIHNPKQHLNTPNYNIQSQNQSGEINSDYYSNNIPNRNNKNSKLRYLYNGRN
ncbi:mucin-like protein [Cryptosporidium canis]|uniref:Mucin-like protein n=1 Tax=Cryptosporidium canis TaxID=195482 RepID=A0A9D5HYH0_9CRYT|nr:mucin-like protein [Cryptosporidium canis]